MAVELPARGVRVGGITVVPGEARRVAIPLAGREPAAAARAVPAWVVVGARPGPRVSVVAGLRGIEATAVRAAARLAGRLDPAALSGSVVVVPVFRPGGQLMTRVRPSRALPFPGDAGGSRAARDAFTLFSDVVVGAQALIVLDGPARGRRGLLVARAAPGDPRARRLAGQSGAAVVIDRSPRPGSLAAAAAGAQAVVVELSAAFDGGDPSAAEPLAGAARALLAALGLLIEPADDLARAPGTTEPIRAHRTLRVRAPSPGFLEPVAVPGGVVRARGTIGRIEPLLPGPAVPVVAPSAGLVVDAAAAGPVGAGEVVFSLVTSGLAASRGVPAAPPAAQAGRTSPDGKTRLGWVEIVALPGLGIDRLKAKIDTGARTSALHVMRMRTVDTSAGPHRRPILEITVPGGGRGRRPTVVRATARGYAMVKDTSGRIERRPVIETTLKVGPLHRRITVTLTNRGDMLYPMLVGRTALGPSLVVDPSRRFLLGGR
jgi:predicted deacylase